MVLTLQEHASAYWQTEQCPHRVYWLAATFLWVKQNLPVQSKERHSLVFITLCGDLLVCDASLLSLLQS